MTTVPFGIQSYRRADPPEVRLVNCYAEQVPAEKEQVILLPRPALTTTQTLGSGPINGLFQRPGVLSGAVHVVSGQALYQDGAAIGAIANAGQVQMAAADGAVLIATSGAFYRATHGAVAPIAFPDGAGVVAVAYLGGYSIAARANSHRLYFTLNANAWDGLNYVSAEQSTDPIVGMAIVVDQLWVFCSRHTEVFYLTGDSLAPLQRVQGRVFDKGALVRDAIVRMDNTVIWVGQDRIVYRGENTPVRISDHGIEERIAASNPADILAWTYSWLGHQFYVLQLSGQTVAFDAATGQWHELASYGASRWRGRCGIATDVGVMAGDDSTGQLYTLTERAYMDDAAPIGREFTALIAERGFIDTLRVDMSNATGASTSQGALEMRTSRNNGKTWRNWRQAGLGMAGQTRSRALFRRLGLSDETGMVVQFRLTDAVASRVSTISVNESASGRSR